MKIRLYYEKSINENAAIYFEEAKRYKEKRRKAEEALTKMVETLKEEKKKERVEKEKMIKKIREREWFEKFHWFFTSGGKLCIGGRDAKQNDILYGRYLEKDDLFFHADIHGGSVVILKDGERATEEEKIEAAQFAAAFSRAWKEGYAYVDVYSAKPEQLSKSSHGEYVAKGGIVVRGKKEWYKRMPLKLKMGIDERGRVVVLPALSKRKLEKEVFLVPGRKDKGAVAKELAKFYEEEVDEILRLLPSGKTTIIKE